jgi:hypothetical protein
MAGVRASAADGPPQWAKTPFLSSPISAKSLAEVEAAADT